MFRGFTIVEIIVVVTVIGILISIGTIGGNVVLEQSRNSDAESKVNILISALAKYHAENGEYPSAQSLAGTTGDGRALTNAQYDTIASTLRVNVDVLKNGTYKFVPCWIGSSLCCSFISEGGEQRCDLSAAYTNTRYILYTTRRGMEATSGAKLSFKVPSSGCYHNFDATSGGEFSGYSAYMLMYRNFSDTTATTTWRVFPSPQGRISRGAGCQISA